MRFLISSFFNLLKLFETASAQKSASPNRKKQPSQKKKKLLIRPNADVLNTSSKFTCLSLEKNLDFPLNDIEDFTSNMNVQDISDNVNKL
ncbi:hypothetical protein CDAR_504871 [Caerostris darwini]|uniref:Uncharacterized protein n=1 Tax=Caerostris darwini TaxID=1538125 RepID=A0AAV4VQW8_9ARAC|nr:hypothetical protein CDAR_504871 [Caerostris darwini]